MAQTMNKILYPQMRALVLPWRLTRQEAIKLNGFNGSFTLVAVIFLIIGYNYDYVPPADAPIPEALINTVIAQREIEEEKVKEKVKEAEEAKQEATEQAEEAPEEEVEVEPRKDLTTDEQKAREAASKEGLAALSSELQDLGGSGLDAFGDISEVRTVAPGVETGSDDGSSGGLLALESNQAGSGSQLVTARGAIGTGSGASLRKGTAGVASKIRDGAVGGGFGAGGGGNLGKKGGGASSPDVGGGRTAEEIQVIFDTNKGLLDRLYQRELRRNPSLRGEVLFQITIAPQGNVLAVKIISSQLGAPGLEKKMVSRIKLFQFQPKPAKSGNAVIRFPINFLPSG